MNLKMNLRDLNKDMLVKMNLRDLNNDMLVKLIETIQKDKQKRIDKLENCWKNISLLLLVRSVIRRDANV